MSDANERIARLEARLARLEDLESIRQLTSRYCTAVDNKDIAALAPLFARDAVFTVAPWGLGATGHADIVAFYARAFQDSGPTRHYLTNERIEPDGDGYRSTCYFQNAVAVEPKSLRGWGVYEDRFVREDGAWKFARKQVTVQVLGPFDQDWNAAGEVTDVHASMHDH